VVERIDALPPVDGVLLGTPDAALPEMVSALLEWSHLTGCVIVHFAGAVGIDPLIPLIGRGARAAALHPVQTCPSVEAALERLPGSAWGVTVSNGTEGWAASFVEAVAGRPVFVREQDRPLWHAAAVTVSNGLTSLLALGTSILRTIGVKDPASVLGPLASGALENAEKRGPGAALTGPVVRGDAETLRTHIASLMATSPDLVPRFELAIRSVLEAALAERRIDQDAYERMAAVLEEGLASAEVRSR
jgi:predicted short-subunit dehydrogenase-like oxidoreductase (DUF2520 family)